MDTATIRGGKPPAGKSWPKANAADWWIVAVMVALGIVAGVVVWAATPPVDNGCIYRHMTDGHTRKDAGWMCRYEER